MQDDPELDKRRAEAGVPAAIAGCHTAYMGDYIIALGMILKEGGDVDVCEPGPV